jgi:hypothetical protein
VDLFKNLLISFAASAEAAFGAYFVFCVVAGVAAAWAADVCVFFPALSHAWSSFRHFSVSRHK